MPRRRDEFDERDLQPLMNSAISGFLRLGSRQRMVAIMILVVGAIVAAVVYVKYQNQQQAAVQIAAETSPQMLLGNPSSALPDPSNRSNYLMVKPYFVLSYNDLAGIPNWVSWQVTDAYLGDAPRKPIFEPDDALPTGFYKVTHRDYSGSGFDRGHMCPHGDRSANADMSFSSFVMTNVVPQSHNLNEKAWAQVEVYCRDLVRHHHDHLYIMDGPVGRGGRGSHGYAESIAYGRVNVPAQCWKVIVVVPDDGLSGDDLAKITTRNRVITVVMPNDDEAVGEEWAHFRTSPAAVERITGLHFFTRLSPAIARVLEQKIDNLPLPRPRSLAHGW